MERKRDVHNAVFGTAWFDRYVNEWCFTAYWLTYVLDVKSLVEQDFDVLLVQYGIYSVHVFYLAIKHNNGIRA